MLTPQPMSEQQHELESGSPTHGGSIGGPRTRGQAGAVSGAAAQVAEGLGPVGDAFERDGASVARRRLRQEADGRPRRRRRARSGGRAASARRRSMRGTRTPSRSGRCGARPTRRRPRRSCSRRTRAASRRRRPSARPAASARSRASPRGRRARTGRARRRRRSRRSRPSRARRGGSHRSGRRRAPARSSSARPTPAGRRTSPCARPRRRGASAVRDAPALRLPQPPQWHRHGVDPHALVPLTAAPYRPGAARIPRPAAAGLSVPADALAGQELLTEGHVGRRPREARVGLLRVRRLVLDPCSMLQRRLVSRVHDHVGPEPIPNGQYE